jgi:hypothetical protein
MISAMGYFFKFSEAYLKTWLASSTSFSIFIEVNNQIEDTIIAKSAKISGISQIHIGIDLGWG